MAKDPVCGMEVDPAAARHRTEYQGTTYYFCAPGCKRAFEAEPQMYLDPRYKPSMEPSEAGTMHEPFESEHIPVKMYRGADRLVVAAPMAGMEPENIRVEVTADGQLHLHGTERAELKGEKDVLLDEWNPGPYHRRVELPDPVDAELANITYSNGVLVVALPLSSQTRPARLTLERIGPGHGERVGSHGRPVHPTTSAEHHGAAGHPHG